MKFNPPGFFCHLNSFLCFHHPFLIHRADIDHSKTKP